MVGQLTESVVDLRIELDKGGGVAGELFGPLFLLLGQDGLDVHKGLLQRWDFLAGLRAKAELHGWPLARSRLLDTSAILSSSAFPDATFRECARPTCLACGLSVTQLIVETRS